MYKVISTEVLYEGKYSALKEEVEGPDGRRFAHETIKHPGAIVVLPILSDGRMLLIEQYRHSVQRNLLEAVAGTLEAGEDPAVCAQRELSEEIGMVADELTPIGVSLPAPGFCDEQQHFFVARGLREQKGTPDPDEVITAVVMSKSDIEDAIKSGELVDGKSLAIMYRALVLGLL